MIASLRFRGLRAGSLTSVLSAVVTAVVLFALFKLFIGLTSTAAIGCWSLIQGMFLFSRIPDVGVGTNFTRMMALNLKGHFSVSAQHMILAGLLLSTIPVLCIGVALLAPVYSYVAEKSAPAISRHDVLYLTVSAFAVAVLSSSSTICLSVIEGAGKIAHRNIVTIGSNVLGLAVAYPLVSTFGIPGIGFTSIVQSSLLLLFAVYAISAESRLLKQHGSGIKLSAVVAMVWTDNIRMSAIGLLRLSFEPTTKLLLSRFASLDNVALFELALRVTTQARLTYQAGIAPLLSFGSRSKSEPLTPKVAEAFSVANHLVSMVALAASAVQLVAAPFLSLAGFGRVEPDFILYFEVLVLANCLNSFGIAGYYLQVSGGHLPGLVRIHFLMAIINVSCGIALGSALGATGPVLAYGLAFSFGGLSCAFLLYRTLSFNKTIRLDLIVLLALIACVVSAIFASYAVLLFAKGSLVFFAISAVILLFNGALFGFVIWREIVVKLRDSNL
ncbi:hypothetical protein IVB08_09090 [Bradyrhizobium sp. 173]|uniref:hypothetical protein n=1 Tax=Bradyrhizobium sp. 173 TaxID=2782644 RepID=UPI001FF747F5|nr:hypothetical protein [Bradyrhizobium sp. 173]MCK1564121.1 hypothetical protein [Bradyrhizobium sp. 173]